MLATSGGQFCEVQGPYKNPTSVLSVEIDEVLKAEHCVEPDSEPPLVLGDPKRQIRAAGKADYPQRCLSMYERRQTEGGEGKQNSVHPHQISRLTVNEKGFTLLRRPGVTDGTGCAYASRLVAADAARHPGDGGRF